MALSGLVKSRLVSFTTPDGLEMKGYLAIPDDSCSTIIHFHGSCGNFYENDFLPFMAQNYSAAGISFLTVNNRGHDCMAEVYRNKKLEYIGGNHESLEECVLDIQGAIEFAKQTVGGKIILQGHSLGCLKVLIYLVQVEEAYDFILLSPSDSFQLQANYIYPETIEMQIERIKEHYADNTTVMLPNKEFGIKEGDVNYFIPTTAKNLISLFGGSQARLLSYKNPQNYFINSHALIYCGGEDRLQTETMDDVKRFFTQRTLDSSYIYHKGGDHHFHGYENDVTNQIANWARNRLSVL